MEKAMQLEELIRQAQQNNIAADAAITAVLGRFQAAALHWARQILGDDQAAQDAVQEAALIAYEKLPQLRYPAAFSSWYKRIVVSQCHLLLRQQRFPQVALELSPELTAATPDPAAVVEEKELQQNVRTAVAALPEKERVVTRLFYLRGYSQQEIARLLELPLTTVKKRLQYARRSLKPLLGAMSGNLLPVPPPLLTPQPVPVRISRAERPTFPVESRSV